MVEGNLAQQISEPIPQWWKETLLSRFLSRYRNGGRRPCSADFWADTAAFVLLHTADAFTFRWNIPRPKRERKERRQPFVV